MSVGKIAFVGFGEAGQALVNGWSANSSQEIYGYDIKIDDADASVCAGKRADFVRLGVVGCNTLVEALKGAAQVFSLVTADQAAVAAAAVSGCIDPGTLYFDAYSCAPDTKKANARIITDAGAHYVDTAVMGPVHPQLHRTPMLLSGDHAEAGLHVLTALEMKARIAAGEVGTASSIKMIRSVMMKGLEALFLECGLAGRKAGVAEAVFASLDVTFPDFDFPGKTAYMMERVMTHGVRRAAEMREVARTIDDLGLSGRMTRAAIDWHQEIGELHEDAGNDDYQALADRLLVRLL